LELLLVICYSRGSPLTQHQVDIIVCLQVSLQFAWEVSVFAAGIQQKYSFAEVNQMYDHSQQDPSSHVCLLA
jgi:hypothetical protein